MAIITTSCPKCGDKLAFVNTLTNETVCPRCGKVDNAAEYRSKFVQDMQSTCRLSCGCIIAHSGAYITRCDQHAMKGGR